MYGYRLGYNIRQVAGTVKRIFSQYFNDDPVVETVSGVDYLRDTKTGNYPMQLLKQNCFSFDSISYLNLGNIEATNEPEGWLFIQILTTANPFETFMAKGLTSSNTDYCLQYSTTSSVLRFFGYTAGGAAIGEVLGVDISSYVDNNFHLVHYKITVSGGNSTFLVEIDGNVIFSTAVSGTVRVSSNNLLLGARGGADFLKSADLGNFRTPSREFVFNKYDTDGTTTPSSYGDVMGTGAIASVTNGSLSNLASRDNASWNFTRGFATITATGSDVLYPKLDDDSGYVGLTGIEPGFTEFLPFTDESEQTFKAIATAELIAIDVDNFLFDGGGNPIERSFSELVTFASTSNYMQVLKDNNNVIVSWNILS